MPDLRDEIQTALQAFNSQPIRKAALGLLDNLGYRSDRTLILEGSKPHAFLELVKSHTNSTKFDEAKALFSDWKSADILFQLTDDNLAASTSLFKETDIKSGLLRSYLFFAIELKGSDYARGKLSAIARQINRVFPMPVMVLLKHGEKLSIAVINRRLNKVHTDKDVLEKVTLICDISLANPHRGHLDILASFALENLVHPKKLPIQDFDTLHAAWEQIFNVELLSARFYKELANWYFWALPQVDFPADLESDDEKRRATGLIRLLTRLIFCWFLKEKNLIPENLFHPTDLANILKGGPDIPVWDPQSKTSSTYYQAILQNLFFATLNQRMGKDAKGQPHRLFATDEGFQKNRATYDVNNLYRYEKLFAASQDEALAHFADIPFLNGGLFECLDRTEESGADIPVCDSSGKTDKNVRSTYKKRYLDGFSRNPKKRPHIPDRLFFDPGETADLSTAYGDKKRKSERVSGLIHILNRYKFTIVENTPIDQEIALDPELLGKVFENLLASYNEETKTTARKQTGSFYTPRPIVDYMVDESLKAHFKQKVEQTFLSASSSKPQIETSVLPIIKTRRHLPHWKKDGAIYWITFRMADSLPQEKLKSWKAEREVWCRNHPQPWDDTTWKEYDERFGDKLEQWLDAGMGSRALARPEIREVVKNCLLRFDGERLIVHSAVIMPNHVHALIEPLEGHDLSKLLQGIKGTSAREANKLLGATGSTFWLDESYDHIVRSEAQYRHFLRYITENPVKAHLRDHEYWLKEGSADIPVCDSSSSKNTDKNVCATLSARLDQLFTYTEEPHQFSEAEVATLIAAINDLKILDPACGSGAFPMGVLHKLVYILGKLDPDNDRWKNTQLAKLDSAPMREELERAFADNNDDYGRKLYLIENCLYGVDIQPIAIQITKLRFFISLVCDQKTNRNKKDNHGIRPLPNLETKFVAANTLIGLPIPEPDLFIRNLIEPIEKEIEQGYHSHFSIQRRDQKIALQKRIKTLRQKLSDTLIDGLGANKNSDVAKKAQLLADWDAFDPQASADFFDPHWMFGRSLADGFDIVIGNPPYVFARDSAAKGITQAAKDYYYANYSLAEYQVNLYPIFIEAGSRVLNKQGILCFITPNNWLTINTNRKLRQFVLGQSMVSILNFYARVFASADVDAAIVQFQSGQSQSNLENVRLLEWTTEPELIVDAPKAQFLSQPDAIINIEALKSGDTVDLVSKIETNSRQLTSIASVKCGLKAYQKGKGKPVQTEREKEGRIFHSRAPSAGFIKYLDGRDVCRYRFGWSGEYLNYGPHLAEPRNNFGLFSTPRILVRQIPSPPPYCINASFTAETLLNDLNSMNIINIAIKPQLVLAVLNSRLTTYWFVHKFGKMQRGIFPQFKVNELAIFPIPRSFAPHENSLIAAVDCILATKQANPAADTSAVEREIDQQVYALYGLTPEEIAIVEGTGK